MRILDRLSYVISVGAFHEYLNDFDNNFQDAAREYSLELETPKISYFEYLMIQFSLKHDPNFEAVDLLLEKFSKVNSPEQQYAFYSSTTFYLLPENKPPLMIEGGAKVLSDE